MRSAALLRRTGGSTSQTILWDEPTSTFPARPAVTVTTWSGYPDPSKIVGSGFLAGTDVWVPGTAPTPPVVQFFDDFSGDTIGANTPTGWTKRWDSATVSIIDGGGGNKACRINKASGLGHAFLSWGSVGAICDAEVVMKWRGDKALVSGTGMQYHPALVRGTAAAPYSGDMPAFTNNASSAKAAFWVLNDAGVFQVFAPAVTNVPVVFAPNTWYWTRFRAFGDQYYSRFWADGDTEPGTWTVVGYDERISAPGLVGIHANYVEVLDVDCIGVGINGAAAPVTAV